MILLFPFILGLLFILTSLYVWRRSFVFFLFYSLLFVYTFFTQLGYLFYPVKLSAESNFQYYSEGIFFSYWIYIFLSFVSIFLIFIIFYDKKYKPLLKIEIRPSPKKNSDPLYIILILFYEIISIFFLVKNYGNLNYFNRNALNENKIWLFLFSLSGIVLLSTFYKIIMERSRKKRIFYFVLFFSLFSIFSITAIKSGQRIEVAMAILAFIVSLWYLFQSKIMRLRLKHIFLILLICFIGISIIQGIKATRGDKSSLTEFFHALKDPRAYLTLFSPQKMIFQDWSTPSVSLMASMKKHVISPSEVIKSNLTCLIPFVNHKALGNVVAKIAETGGIGFYILTEGYNFIGFIGFLYSTFILVIGWWFLESFFTNTNDKFFNSYMFGTMGFLVFEIVRGQSMMFLKGLYLYFLPAVILFLLISNKKIYLVEKT